MISEKLTQAINVQITREFYSAYMYLAMANDAMDKGFKGARFFYKYYQASKSFEALIKA